MARAKQSAGLVLYRMRGDALEVLLAHPGGPLFTRKDAGVWTIPKGQPGPDEALETAAGREFTEETGLPAPPRPWLSLGEIQQRGGKRVYAWAAPGDCEPGALQCNLFELEWPPKSGKKQLFPELDRFEFFTLEAAKAKINPAQYELLERLSAALQRK